MLSKLAIAIGAASKSKSAVAAAVLTFFGFLALFVYSTIVTAPGNSLEFWLQLTPDLTKVLVVLLAGVMAVLFGLIIYSFQQKASVKQAGIGAVASGTAFFAALVGTTSCLSCLVAFLGFLGLNTLFTLLDYQQPILAGGFVVALASVYLVSNSVASNCVNGKCIP